MVKMKAPGSPRQEKTPLSCSVGNNGVVDVHTVGQNFLSVQKTGASYHCTKGQGQTEKSLLSFRKLQQVSL